SRASFSRASRSRASRSRLIVRGRSSSAVMENVGSGMPNGSRGLYSLARLQLRTPDSPCLANGRADTLRRACIGPSGTMPEQLGGFGIVERLRAQMKQVSTPASISAATSTAPARIADATRARELALAFDLR